MKGPCAFELATAFGSEVENARHDEEFWLVVLST